MGGAFRSFTNVLPCLFESRRLNKMVTPTMRQSLRYFLFIIGTCAALVVILTGYPYKLQMNRLLLIVKTPSLSETSGHVVKVTGSYNDTKEVSTYKPQSTKAKEQTTTNKTTVTSRPLPPLKSNDNKFFLYNDDLPPDVTVVTAYFNLGSFRKGGAGTFNTAQYMTWATVYSYNRNPLVFYTDSEEIASSFSMQRSGYENITKVIVMNRTSMWAFSWVDRIRKIYSNPSYPKYHPNTVIPEYTCSQHAKYNVMEDAVKHDYFNTTYFTWIDFGYFRNIVGRNKEFVITKPYNFNESHVAMNKVFTVSLNASVEDIFKGNKVWIGGGMFFGSKDTLPTFIMDYRQAVERYLNMSLSSTDQQVLYAMHTKGEKSVARHRVPIQQYIPTGPGDPWFYLGYSSYRELS